MEINKCSCLIQHSMQTQAITLPHNNTHQNIRNCSQQTLCMRRLRGWKLKRDSHLFHVVFALQIAGDSVIGVKFLDKSLMKDVQVSLCVVFNM